MLAEKKKGAGDLDPAGVTDPSDSVRATGSLGAASTTRDAMRQPSTSAARIWARTALPTLRQKPTGRYREYVFILTIPRPPSRHPGVDDSLHPTRTMHVDHIDAYKLGQETVSFLMDVCKRKVCPRVLFLSSPDEPDYYTEHLLKTYIAKMAKEKQYELTFHIAAHGDPDEIGYGLFHFDTESFLDFFMSMINLHDPQNTAKLNSRPIHFVFHCCNSATIEIPRDADNDTIKAAILEKSFIGKFARLARAAGLNISSVTGYRGYYTRLNRSNFVAQSTIESQPNTVTFPLVKAEVTIFFSDSTSTPFVRLPDGHGKDFPVLFMSGNPPSELESKEANKSDPATTVMRGGPLTSKPVAPTQQPVTSDVASEAGPASDGPCGKAISHTR